MCGNDDNNSTKKIQINDFIIRKFQAFYTCFAKNFF